MLYVIYKWLIGDMGEPGDFQYQAIHGWTMAVVSAVLAVVIFLGVTKKISTQGKRKILVGIAVFHVVFEVAWRLIYFFVKGDELRWWWPMWPCNLSGILIPIIALSNWKTGKKMFYLFAFVGAILTFALPEDIFTTNVMVFPIVKSVIQHTGILLIPVYEYCTGTYRPRLKDMGWVVTGLLVHLLNCEGISRLFGFTGDYMFMRGDMPFVIPGVPQFITISVFALLVLTGLSLLCELPGRVNNKRRSKENEKRCCDPS